MLELTKAREIMTKYFSESGFSRVASDYANKFLLEYYPSRERDDSIIKTDLRVGLEVIAHEIMYPDQLYAHTLKERVTLIEVLNGMTNKQLKNYCKKRGI